MYVPKTSGLAHLLLRHPILIIGVLAAIAFSSYTARKPHPVVSLNFDDGYTSTYSKAFPILKRYRLPATTFIITDKVGEPGFMNLEQLRTLRKAGWEIGSHTVTHPHLTQIPEVSAYGELYLSKRALEEWGFEVSSFAVPFGDTNDRIWERIKERYRISRGIDEGLNPKPFPKHNLKCIIPKADTKIEEIKGWIDKCVEEKAWLILAFHRIGETGEYNNSEEFLEEICQYIKNKHRVKVLKLRR